MPDLPPYWPRGLKLELAAAYIGLSPSTFLSAVEKGEIPAAVWITAGRKIWLREHLDGFLDAKAGRAAPCPPDNPLDALLDARRAAAAPS